MAIFTQKLSIITILGYFMRNNEIELQVELTRDFKEGTRIRNLYPEKDSSGALIQLQFAGREVLGNNFYIKRKNLNSYLFWFLEKGNKSYIQNNIIRHVTANHFAVEDCMLETTGWVTPSPDNVGSVQYYIHFYPTPLVRSIADFMFNYSPCIQLDRDEFGFVGMVTDILNDIDADCFDERRWSERFYSFFLDVVQYIKTQRSEQTKMPKAVSDTLNFISNNYRGELNLKACADNVHLSPNYLDGLFSKHMNTSIGAYISKYRFKEATELLLSSDKSISEIAFDVGLPDSQSLIRLFKKNIGMTPLAYKKFYNRK